MLLVHRKEKCSVQKPEEHNDGLEFLIGIPDATEFNV
jgi:hypothetical protein